MFLKINDEEYEIIITYKRIKNMYLRVKNDLKIYITCNKYISQKMIDKFIDENITSIEKQLQSFKQKNNKSENHVRYLGKYYEIVYIKENNIIFTNDKVFLNKNLNIDNFYKQEAKKIFKERLDYIYNRFLENIPYPGLKIRHMTSRWGVCNTKTKFITLNLDLIKIDIKYLDYVIVHELSHLIYPNHSKDFWNVVKKYESNYKKLRKEMKDIL